jgi:O-antigen/teichoic acid export membrane protein
VIHAGSVLTSNVVNRMASFIVYAMVARQLGAVSFGHLALATSVMMLGGRFVGLGLNYVMVRSAARHPEDSARLLGASLPAMVAAWVVGLAAVETYVLLAGHGGDASAVIRILYVGGLGYAISQTCEGLLVARDPNRIPRITAPIWLVQTGVAAWIIYGAGMGVVVVSLSILAAHFAVAVVSVIVVLRLDGARLRLGTPRESWALVGEAKTFLALNMANTAASSTMLIIVDSLGTEVEVGIYAAAQQLFTPVALLSEATAMALYPVLVRRMAADRKSRRFIKLCSEAVFAIVIPAAVGLMLLAEPLLSLVYGDETFTGGSAVMRVLAVSVAFRGVSLLFGQVLFAGNDEHASLGYSVIRATGVIGLGWILMSTVGLVGAALATVITGMIHAGLHVRRVKDTIGTADLVSASIPAVLSATGMGLVLWLLLESVPVYLLVGIGGLTHAILITLIYRVSGRWEFYRSDAVDR